MVVSPSMSCWGEWAGRAVTKERLKNLLQRKSIVWGKVRLSSGQESDYYFDCKLTTLDPEGAFLTGHAVLDLLEEHGVQADAIGGPLIPPPPHPPPAATPGPLPSEREKRRPPPPRFFSHAPPT